MNANVQRRQWDLAALKFPTMSKAQKISLAVIRVYLPDKLRAVV